MVALLVRRVIRGRPAEAVIPLPFSGMGTTFHGPSPWPYITRAIRTRGPRHAAIAHLGEDAPTLLPLRACDVLVVNASRAAVRAHATSPVALTHYVDAGVRVLLIRGPLIIRRSLIAACASAFGSSPVSNHRQRAVHFTACVSGYIATAERTVAA